MYFSLDIGNAIKTACDHDSDAMLLARVAQFVCREMFDKKFHLMDQMLARFGNLCCFL